MSLVAREPEGAADFERVPAGTYPARCFSITDLGTQTVRGYTPEDPDREVVKVILGWELVGTNRGDDRPHLMTQIFTNSLHKKANLRLALEAWRGAAFNESELRGFNLRKVLGVACLLGVVHTDKGDRTFADVSGVMKPPVGTEVAQLWGPTTVFDITAPDWNIYTALPEWQQKMIRKAAEFTGVPEAIVPPGVAPASERPPGAGPRPFAPAPAALTEQPTAPAPPPSPAAVANMNAPAPGETFGQEPPDESAPF